jgi:exodeoxyribonuclease VII small subunit
MMSDEIKSPDEMKYEEAFQELKEVVSKLESSELSLEEGLTLFERGQALAARCSVLLEDAELKLKQLVPDEDGEYSEETIE